MLSSWHRCLTSILLMITSAIRHQWCRCWVQILVLEVENVILDQRAGVDISCDRVEQETVVVQAVSVMLRSQRSSTFVDEGVAFDGKLLVAALVRVAFHGWIVSLMRLAGDVHPGVDQVAVRFSSWLGRACRLVCI